MKNKIRFILSNKDYYIIFVASFLLSIPLAAPGLFNGHDMNSHVYRVVATVDALKSHQWFPMIGSRLADGFGYSWNIFYAPLSAYIPALFKFFVPTFTGAIKLYIFFTIFMSGLTMYHFAKDFLKSPLAGVIAALLYITAPYRLVDIYTRGAMGEILTFVFLPVFFHGLYHLIFGDKKKSFYITIGFSGMILSHNVGALITLLGGSLYLLIYVKRVLNIEVLKKLIINILFTIGITLFFTLPLLLHKFGANYEVFIPNRMGSLNSMAQSTVPLSKLFFEFRETDGKFPFHLIGLQFIIPLIALRMVFKKIEDKQYMTFIGLGLLFICMVSTFFPWRDMPETFSYIQYPWRFLMLVIFFLSLPAAKILVNIIENVTYKHVILIFALLFLYISPFLANVNMDPSINDENRYSKTDPINPESLTYSYSTASFEYLTENGMNSLGYIVKRGHDPIVLNGQATINDKSFNGTNMQFSINSTIDTTIELPYFYYLGWKAELLSNDKTEYLPTFESKHGLVAIHVPAVDNAKVIIHYGSTGWTKISYIISFLTILLFVWLYIKNKNIAMKQLQE